MLASSCAVVLYLWRHMKNMEDSGLVSPRLQRQIKMIITGITAQALLHFLCSDGVIIFQIIIQYTELDVDWNNNILCTIIALYSFGTTINMMVALYLVSLCVMLASSCAVVLYLWRHMKNVEGSGLVSPRLQRQRKMTITGVTAQALLHFLCSFGREHLE
ncbi:hypothetical protein AOLI_G00091810 [Acnodon oligacanthus]